MKNWATKIDKISTHTIHHRLLHSTPLGLDNIRGTYPRVSLREAQLPGVIYIQPLSGLIRVISASRGKVRYNYAQQNPEFPIPASKSSWMSFAQIIQFDEKSLLRYGITLILVKKLHTRGRGFGFYYPKRILFLIPSPLKMKDIVAVRVMAKAPICTLSTAILS